MVGCVKVCGCCGASYSAREWMKLPPSANGALWDLFHEGGGLYSLRNCSCGSTMALTLIGPKEEVA